ncbi:hypothetical protein OROMI_016708 [Orobanche minor]
MSLPLATDRLPLYPESRRSTSAVQFPSINNLDVKSDSEICSLLLTHHSRGIAIEKALVGSSSKLQYKIDQMDKGEIQIKINLRFELKKVELLIKHKDEKIEIMENSI